MKDASTTWSLASIFTVCASGAVSVYPGTCSPASSSVIVHEVDDRLIGIVIDKVLDVVETSVVRSEVGRRAGVLGSALIEDRVTDLVDLDAVVALSGVGA